MKIVNKALKSMCVEYFVDLLCFRCTRESLVLLFAPRGLAAPISSPKWGTLSRSFATRKFLLDKLETLQPIRKDLALSDGVCAFFLSAVEPEL